jgi:ribosomal protein L9
MAVRDRVRQEKLARRRIPKLTVEVKRQVLQDGSLHSNVTAEVIVEKAIKQYSFLIEASSLDLPVPISNLGTHEVPVKLGEAVVPLKVSIVKR